MMLINQGVALYLGQRDAVRTCYIKTCHSQASLMPVILVTQEADVRRISIQSQHRQIVHDTLS
jgi:hypothetical protein